MAEVMESADLRSTQFRFEREDSWRELEQLLHAIDRSGLRSLTPAQLNRLPNLYRAAVSSLSVARAISLDRNLIDYLDHLCIRAYFVAYGPKSTFRQVVGNFVLRTFPGNVRKFRWHLVAATLLLFLGGLVGYFLTLHDPDNYYTFVAPEMAQDRTPAASREDLEEVLFSGDDEEEGVLALFSSTLFTHNSAVGILCFATSLVPMALTALLLFYNGGVLGAMSALHHDRDLGVEWWSWVLPHGVTEILAILLCAAAGLAVGQSVLFPGELPRLQSLARRGREAALVVMGALGLFFLAAIVEGVFRQRVQSIPVRYTVVSLTAVFWIAYFGFVGRRAR